MIKYFIVLVLISLICVIETSVFFMDESTADLLYNNQDGESSNDVKKEVGDLPADTPDPQDLAKQLMEDVQKEAGVG